MNKKLLVYLGFFVVLILVFWFFLNKYTPWFQQSKIYKDEAVQSFSFKNQNGVVFNNNDMEGKVCVVEYFFTKCPGICPVMNNNMKKVYEEFKNEPNFLILSYTSDPANDSVPKLKHYADSLKVNSDKWIFLTGSKDSLYNLARNSFNIADKNNVVANIEDDFVHTQLWALVDKSGKVVVKKYDGLKPEEIETLKEDIKTLLKEKSTEANFSNKIFN
jgi:protein SCO1/2